MNAKFERSKNEIFTSTFELLLEKDASAPTIASHAPALPNRSRLLSKLHKQRMASQALSITLFSSG